MLKYGKLLKAGKAKAMPGAIAAVEMLSAHGVPMAIASGSSKLHIGWVLRHLKIRHHFSAIASRQEVLKGKPYPDVYLEAARRLNTEPKNCIAFEDTAIGIAAAKAAGMIAVAVTADDDFPEASETREHCIRRL
jgi:HAD superfamily hydrolase (TIGR01509 family)